MDRAKAMYLGGEIIDAHDCNYSSYYNDGLRCAVCGEPVFLKRGSIRKPHFAHHSGTDPQQVEECELRLSSYGNSSQINSFIKDRGQRLKLFRDHFLSLISFENDVLITNSEFNNWINSIKRDYDKGINNIITNCTNYFLRYRYKIVAKYIKSITIDNNKLAFEQQEIALEAISYLCIKSSCKLLEYLLYYGIYKLYKDKQHKLFKQDITTQDVDNICTLVIKIIMFNNWIEALNNEKLIGSRIKLKQEREIKPDVITVSPLKTELLTNWSMLFNRELQVTLEQDRLILYRLPYQYQSNIQVDNYSMSQDITKIADLGSIEIIQASKPKWIAILPRYEYLAKQLNKSGKIASTEYNKFNGLFLYDQKLIVGDRILCQKQSLNDQIKIVGHFNHKYQDMRYQWLSEIFDKALLKITQDIINEHKVEDTDKLDQIDNSYQIERKQKLNRQKRLRWQK